MSFAVPDRARSQEPMGIPVGPAARLRENLPLLSACWSMGLLAIGYWISTAELNQRRDVGQLVQCLAAVIASLPALIRLVWGFWQASTEVFTDQLVVLAIFGALATGEYSTAVLIPVIMDLGHFIEQRSIQGTQAAIDGVQRLNARAATIVDESGERRIAPSELRIGQTLLVRSGEVIAADGLVCNGHSSIDESTITGESLPRDVCPGNLVHAGTIVVDGVLHVTVTATGEQTSLGKIRGMLDEALSSKAPVTRMLEQYAELYVPFVLLIAASVLLLTRDVQRVIAVFVVSCPCALVLSGPAAMIAALATATRQGILIKNTKFLESLADADTIVFDKTGTLTEGLHQVAEITPAPDIHEDQILQDISSCVSSSIHPISRALAVYCRTRGHDQPVENPTRIRSIPGHGIEAEFHSRVVRLGRAKWLEQFGVQPPPNLDHTGPIVHISSNATYLGCVLLQDGLRPESPRVIEELRDLGIRRMVLLTGDSPSVAIPIAESLSLDEVISDALPQDKLNFVKKEVFDGRKVIVVGDGINDALALAAGSVGIALGARGADIAIESADIALMKNDLGRITAAVRLSRRTRRIIQQNILAAIGTAGVMLALGSFGLLPPLFGAVLHNVGTVLVLVNSARALRADG